MVTGKERKERAWGMGSRGGTLDQKPVTKAASKSHLVVLGLKLGNSPIRGPLCGGQVK